MILFPGISNFQERISQVAEYIFKHFNIVFLTYHRVRGSDAIEVKDRDICGDMTKTALILP
jgi:hypothetical protein